MNPSVQGSIRDKGSNPLLFTGDKMQRYAITIRTITVEGTARNKREYVTRMLSNPDTIAIEVERLYRVKDGKAEEIGTIREIE